MEKIRNEMLSYVEKMINKSDKIIKEFSVLERFAIAYFEEGDCLFAKIYIVKNYGKPTFELLETDYEILIDKTNVGKFLNDMGKILDEIFK